MIEDWFDNGAVDNTYPVGCYRDALKSLPEDMQAYSSAPDDIRAAMQASLRGSGGSSGARGMGSAADESGDGAEADAGSASGSSGGRPSGSGKGSAAGAGSRDAAPAPMKKPASSSDGAFRQALEDIGPNDPASFPTPLLVLAGIAAAVLALGTAGLIGRRLQARRSRIDE